ncbi:hypothetical protein [Halosolutus gelatinilyticus]|uniref:hypothetical protein n=1 Tax=Halosolutus gelatinilyticus TaxID=2931975 RepID=UPI001FF41F4A|nr:hypothetical protein [Halosolutus gelatinilyticus]
MSDEEVKARIIEKLLRKHSTGPSATPIDEVPSWFPSHQKGDSQESVKELLRDPESPVVEAPGIAVTNIELGSVDRAVEYLQSRERQVPWFLQEGYGEDPHTLPDSSEDRLHDRISDLEDELEMMNETAEDWRSEARRRQRLGVLFGAIGFMSGFATSGLLGYIF